MPPDTFTHLLTQPPLLTPYYPGYGRWAGEPRLVYAGRDRADGRRLPNSGVTTIVLWPYGEGSAHRSVWTAYLLRFVGGVLAAHPFLSRQSTGRRIFWSGFNLTGLLSPLVLPGFDFLFPVTITWLAVEAFLIPGMVRRTSPRN